MQEDEQKVRANYTLRCHTLLVIPVDSATPGRVCDHVFYVLGGSSGQATACMLRLVVLYLARLWHGGQWRPKSLHKRHCMLRFSTVTRAAEVVRHVFSVFRFLRLVCHVAVP